MPFLIKKWVISFPRHFPCTTHAGLPRPHRPHRPHWPHWPHRPHWPHWPHRGSAYRWTGSAYRWTGSAFRWRVRRFVELLCPVHASFRDATAYNGTALPCSIKQRKSNNEETLLRQIYIPLLTKKIAGKHCARKGIEREARQVAAQR
jgi:hypothetical protein